VKKKLFNRHYVCTGGIGSWDHHHHQFGDMLFKPYHKFVDQEQMHYNSLLEILKIQNHLKSLGVPFYFTGMINQFNSDPDTMLHHTCEYGVTRYSSNKELVDSIDFNHWIFGPDQGGIYETVKQAGLLWDQDNFHPSIPGYEYWVDFVVARLKEDKIL
jgi:lysophospholipase L1-like esterase